MKAITDCIFIVRFDYSVQTRSRGTRVTRPLRDSHAWLATRLLARPNGQRSPNDVSIILRYVILFFDFHLVFYCNKRFRARSLRGKKTVQFSLLSCQRGRSGLTSLNVISGSGVEIVMQTVRPTVVYFEIDSSQIQISLIMITPPLLFTDHRR